MTNKPLAAALAAVLLAATGLAAAQSTSTATGNGTPPRNAATNTANSNSGTGMGSATNAGVKGTNPMGYTMSDAEFNTYYSAMDTNHDGIVSRQEYMNYYGMRYDNYDTGRKGTLDRSTVRRLMLEREMSKTDGSPQGVPSPAPMTTTRSPGG